MPATPVRRPAASLARGRPGPARLLLTGFLAALVGGLGTVSGPISPPTVHAAALDTTAAAAPDPSAPTPVPDPVTFYGRGWGHGVGLSQYGAFGRANAGQSTTTILDHYYQNTTSGSVDPATPIRVLVLSSWTPSEITPLLIIGHSGTWSIDGQTGTFPDAARLTLAPPAAGTTAWHLVVTASNATTVLLDTTVSSSFRVRPVDTATRLQLYSKPSYYDTYRGVLRVLPGTTTVNVVNELTLDLYLRGVVPSEMPSSWPSAALRAQAIAARSYAKRQLNPSTGTWDVYDDTRSQVYHGVLGEATSTNTAVSDTAGVVRLYNGSVIDALYHSTAGGATEHNENAFTSSSGATGTPYPYLRGSPDVDALGDPYDKASPYATWKTATYTLAELSAMFAADSRTNVGTLTALDLSHKGVSGRLIYVILIGSGGSKQVSGGVFRSVFNAQRPSSDPMLRSTLFDLQPIGGVTLAALPASRSVKQGAGTTFAITLTRKYFGAPVVLTVSGLPAGATGTFAPATAPGTTSTLTITTAGSGTITPEGTYPLTITGTSGAQVPTTAVDLVVTDGIGPAVVAPVSTLYALATMASASRPVRTAWSAADPSGVALYSLQRQRDGGSWGSITLTSATSTSATRSLLSGHSYRYRLRATDGAGNISAYVYGPTFQVRLAEQTSTMAAWTGTWHTGTYSSYSGGTVRYATGAGAAVTYQFTGSSIAWLANRGPTRGSAQVYVDGLLSATVSLNAASSHSKQIVFAASWPTNGTHTIRIVNLATAGHARIDVDGFIRIGAP